MTAEDAERRLTELAQTYRTSLGAAGSLVARYEADDDGTARMVLHGIPGHDAAVAHLRLVGRHNADDALGAAGAAIAYGADAGAVIDGLRIFRGVGRRFELKGDVGGVVVLDDYGHHPTAIRATLDAVALRYPGHRVWAVYEPLTFHRTAAMLDAVRRRAGPGGPGGDRRHLRRARPRHDDRLRRRSRRRGRGARHAGDRPGLGRGHRRRRSRPGSSPATSSW